MLVCAVSLLGVGGLEMMATSPVDAPGAKPRIAIVATGGTIAGAAESTTAAGYKSGAVSVDVLINVVPQMKKFAASRCRRSAAGHERRVPGEAGDRVEGRALGELAVDERLRSVFLRRLARDGTSLPIIAGTIVHGGDVVTLIGPAQRVATASYAGGNVLLALWGTVIVALL